MRGGGVQKMYVFVHAQDIKKWQYSVHDVVVECSLIGFHDGRTNLKLDWNFLLKIILFIHLGDF